jgi:hypothetical protein
MTVTNDQSLLQKLQRCHVLSETLRTNEALREAAGFLLNHSSDNGNVLASAIAVHWGWDRLSQQSVSRVNAGPAVWWCTYTFLTCSAVTANPGWSAGLTGPLHSCLHALCTDRSITRSRQEARPRALVAVLIFLPNSLARADVRACRPVATTTHVPLPRRARCWQRASHWVTDDRPRSPPARALALRCGEALANAAGGGCRPPASVRAGMLNVQR